MKRVLLIVVDGCTSRILGPAIDRGELPLLGALARSGWLDLRCVSIFPSITPAATASIVTGRYPARHGIAGMSWWNPSSGQVAYYGDDVWTVLKRGPGEFLRDFLLRLNGERLRSPTMFEVVERQGLRAACFNHLIFRGDVEHELTQPILLQLLPSVGSSLIVRGPSWLSLGDFVSSRPHRHDLQTSGGVFNRFGLDDEGTAGFLSELPDATALPDFTVAYFADYDFESHQRGPGAAIDTLRTLDGRLASLFDGWGGVDRVLRDVCIVLTADHSHSGVDESDRAGILLQDLLSGFRCGDPAAGWRDGDELLLCPNMRAAEVYVRDGRDIVDRVAHDLLEDERVDHVIWCDRRDGGACRVATGDRGALHFTRARGRTDAPRDDYGTPWDLNGEPAALDIRVQNGRIRYGAYPNALERVANSIEDPRSGRMWVTARPGHEFGVTGQSVHPGAGSHGTLHELDSLVPLLVAGHPAGAERRTAPARIVDAAPIAAAALGIHFDVAAGQSHA
ncbi:MAG TPA: alkaline phosphatase family protein [Vicinamibacterales bacterium]|nr:alkaline phosphatase family protein [Vicinamibacterales bacterium]